MSKIEYGTWSYYYKTIPNVALLTEKFQIYDNSISEAYKFSKIDPTS